MARRIAASYGHESLSTELAESDPAWWPTLERTWSQGAEAPSPDLDFVWGTVPAIDEPRRGSWVGRSCGVATQERALAVVLGPRLHDCVACATEMFFIDRSAHALLFWIGL